MSYGRFEYANLAVDQAAVTTSGTVTVSVDVTNVAQREADEVVQLYVHQRSGSASRPVRELKGFRRVTLAAGESRALKFPVGPDERRYWNAAARDWVSDASSFDVWSAATRRRGCRRRSRSPRSSRLGGRSLGTTIHLYNYIVL